MTNRNRWWLAALLTVAVAGGVAARHVMSGRHALRHPVEAAPATRAFMAAVESAPVEQQITGDPERLEFFGRIHKDKTVDPRVLGKANFLRNNSAHEYRVRSFDYVMDLAGLQDGEAVESDLGITVLPIGKLVALNSGEELSMTHLYHAAARDDGIAHVEIPGGGLALKPGEQLSVGSVSAIFLQKGGGAQLVEDRRLAGAGLMPLYFKAVLQRADRVPAPADLSYRSPFRDRSYVADPARQRAPYTDFRNSSTHPVALHGVGVFLGNLSDSEASSHALDILVNGRPVQHLPLPPHQPGVSSDRVPMLIPLSLQLQPGDVVGLRGQVVPKRAIIFDFAAYLIAEPGLEPAQEQLGVLEADVNGDGVSDILDIDAAGSLWVSLRFGDHLQSTQLEWLRDLRGVSALKVVQSRPLRLQASNAQGLCLLLDPIPAEGRFALHYCADPPDPAGQTFVWGDFNGDGWIDRLRVDPGEPAYRVALGGPHGLGPESTWVRGYGAVDRMFVSDADGDGKSDIEAEWSEAGHFRCLIWASTGSSFVPQPCQSAP